MNAAGSEETVTKGAFAAAIGVSPGRVSQYIAERKIHGLALAGVGRSARIRPSIAEAQLRNSLEPSQRLGGNGTAMRRPTGDGLFSTAPTPAETPAEPLDDIAAERLKQMRIKTVQAERQEALEAGRYMLTDTARREMGKAVGEAFKVMEQGLQEMATALAEQFSIPQRDAHQALQKAFRDVRQKAAAGFRTRAAEASRLVDDGDAEDERAA